MDDLFICRQVMRMYTCCGVDSNRHLTIKMCPDILQEYFTIDPILRSLFSNANIEMYPSLVYSCYNGIFKYELQNLFIYRERKYPIPETIFECLTDFLSKNGIAVKPHSNYEIYFGYTGRTYSRADCGKFVTDGLQRDNPHEIIIDFSLYEKAHHNTLHHRLIHEILHVLGISEEDMPNVIYPACIYSYDKANAFIEELLQDCAISYESFKQQVRSIQQGNPELTQKITDLSNLLYQEKGFFQPADKIELTSAWHPIAFSPPYEKEYQILFM